MNDRDQAARTKGKPMSETQDECSPASHCSLALISVHQMKAAVLFGSAVMLVHRNGGETLRIVHVDGDDPVIVIAKKENGQEQCVSWDGICQNYEMVIKSERFCYG